MMILSMMIVSMMMMMMCVDVSMAAASSRLYTNHPPITIISQQQSILNVVRDLQKYQFDHENNNEDGSSNTGSISNTDNGVILSYLITSRSVTTKQRKEIINEILQINTDYDDVKAEERDNSRDDKILCKAMATSNGMILVQPSTATEAVQLLSSSSSNSNNDNTDMIPSVLLYYPDPMDIQRGEGLMDTLGPVLESILQHPVSQSSLLYVMIPKEMELEFVQTQMEQAIQSLLPYFILQNNSSSSDRMTIVGNIRDILRSKIMYSSPQSVMDTVRDRKSVV